MGAGNTTGDRSVRITSPDASEQLAGKLRSLRFEGKEREIEKQAVILGVPYFNLKGFPINPDSVSLIPEDEARSLGLVCFWYSIDDLRLGSINPTSPAVREKVAALGAEHHTPPMLYLISYESLRLALDTYHRVPRPYVTTRGVSITADDLAKYGKQTNTLGDIKAAIAGASTSDVVTAIVAGALQTRASDIHIEASNAGLALRFRIDGVLYPVLAFPATMYDQLVKRLKLLSGLKINITDKPQDGRFTIAEAADKIDVRISTLPSAYGESVVLRLLRWNARGVALETLGLTGRAQEALVAEMAKPNGMILTTGPTGSGKTTTLYAMLVKLARPENKIITLEDPIEYQLPGVTQSQIDQSHGYTFAAGLRSMLRQDPNIVMVGEIRDAETADIAANAALTGHLVLSTLHTNNAAGAIPRLLNIGLARFLLPAALNVIVGQRLVRRLCEFCKTTATPDATLQARVDAIITTLPKVDAETLPKKISFYTSPGCEKCQQLGYLGQIGIFEVLVVTEDIENAILSGSELSESAVLAMARKHGMRTMAEDGVLKAVQGITSLEEVFRVTSEAD